MSADLIVEYFRRDLDAAEEESLAKLLADSPEAAERFAAAAADDYASMGLPEPGTERQRRWLPLIVLGAAAVAVGATAWLGRPQASPVAVIAENGDGGFDVVERPHPQAAEEAAPAAEEAPRLFVQAQTPRGPFDIRVSGAKAEAVGVFNAKGLRIASLQALDSRRFRWDGRDEDGQAVGAGPYQLRLEAKGRLLKQWVEIEVR